MQTKKKRNKSLSKLLKEGRKNMGLSSDEAAGLLGIPGPTLRTFTHRGYVPKGRIAKFEKIFGFPNGKIAQLQNQKTQTSKNNLSVDPDGRKQQMNGLNEALNPSNLMPLLRDLHQSRLQRVALKEIVFLVTLRKKLPNYGTKDLIAILEAAREAGKMVDVLKEIMA